MCFTLREQAGSPQANEQSKTNHSIFSFLFFSFNQRERERERERDRQTDRQTDRQKGRKARQTDTHRHRHRHRPTDRPTKRDSNTKTDREFHSCSTFKQQPNCISGTDMLRQSYVLQYEMEVADSTCDHTRLLASQSYRCT